MEIFTNDPGTDSTCEAVLQGHFESDESDQAPDREIALADWQGWEFIRNGKDARIIATVSFAEQLALYAQEYLSQGKQMEEAWVEAIKAADTTDITRDMKHMATRMLVKHWAYGEQLQQLIETGDDDFFATESCEDSGALDGHFPY